MTKKTISFAIVFILSFNMALASANVIYDNVSETVITKGVTEKYIHRFSSNGWQRIYTLKIDLNENFLSLKTLTSKKGINTRENVLELANQWNALAAVNADFFQPSGSNPSRASAIGAVVDDGHLLTTPARGKQMATVAMDYNNIVSMGIWDQYIKIVLPDGQEKQIFHINKYYDDGALVIFNSDWDEYSPGAPIAPIEMVVENDTVTDIRVWQEGVKFPENSYVIASTTADDTFLTDNFEIGDTVNIVSWFEPNPEKYKMAVGAGTMLLKDGNDAPVTHNISGIQPRTAMGTDRTGKTVYLVTVDGRQSASAGMSLGELRNYMREIGCYNAVNFDGGGSTTFVSKHPQESQATLKNVVSDGAMRKVANAVGIVSDSPVGAPAILDITGQDKGIYAKSACEFSVKVYDEYYHSLNVPMDEIKLSLDGIEGYFAGNVLYPLSSGYATITAEYKSLKTSVHKFVRPPLQTPDTDIMRQPENAETQGTKIAVLGSTEYKTILGKLYALRAVSKANSQADAIAIAGKAAGSIVSKAGIPAVYGEYYYAAYKKNNIIIQLDNSKGGLLKSDPNQWSRFLSQLDDIPVKNVIITLSSPLDSFNDKHELNLFKQILEEKLVEKNKNVFVVYDSTENTVNIENGIRYFGLKGIKDVKSTNFTSLKECCYLLITSDGDDVSYQIKTIL